MVERIFIFRVLTAATALFGSNAFAGDLTIEDQVACLEAPRIRQRLEAVLATSTSAAARFDIAVIAVPSTRGPSIRLRIIDVDGQVPLDRVFDVEREDCTSTAELIEVVLRQFLHELPAMLHPRARAPEPQPSPAPEPTERERLTQVVEREVSWLSGAFFTAASGRLVPVGAALEVGFAVHVGSGEHRLITSAASSIASPHELGSGNFFATSAMLGVGWRYLPGAWRIDLQVRAGTVIVTGYGFRNNETDFLPWVEGHAAVLYRIGPIELGLFASASPLTHEVNTSKETETGQISPLRVGLGLSVPVFSNRL